jgi:hypothetical protein
MGEPFSQSRWRTATIRELYDTYPPCEVALEFPELSGTNPDIADLKVMLRSDAVQWLVDTRTLRLAAEEEQDKWHSKVPSQLTSSYEVSCLTESIISIRFSVFQYGAGAAHPNPSDEGQERAATTAHPAESRRFVHCEDAISQNDFRLLYIRTHAEGS